MIEASQVFFLANLGLKPNVRTESHKPLLHNNRKTKTILKSGEKSPEHPPIEFSGMNITRVDENKCCTAKYTYPLDTNTHDCAIGHQQPEILKRHVCNHPNCTKSYINLSSLSQHRLYQHKSPRRFKCTTCPSEFARKADREKHERIHSGTYAYQCNLCEKQFIQSSNAYTHARRKHKTHAQKDVISRFS